METNIKRTVLNITTYCNLKCKHCLAFIPYYDQKFSMSYETAKKILENYFKIVDSVGAFYGTGGEPLLNKDVYPILQEVYKYKAQIKGSIDFVTNGTIEIPDEILDWFEEHKKETKVVLSNYGEKLSVKIDSIEEKLKKRKIVYRVSKFTEMICIMMDGSILQIIHSSGIRWKREIKMRKNASIGSENILS